MPVTIIDTLQRGGLGTAPFPVIKEDDSRLSYITVADLAARDLIPEWKRLPFMRVHVISDDTDYRLGLDVTLAGQVWTVVNAGITPGTYQLISEKNQPSGYVGLEANSKINPIYIDNIYANNSYVVADVPARNVLTTVTGDIVQVLDTGQIFVKLNNNPPTNVDADFAELLFPGTVLSVNGQVGVVTITIASLLADPTNVTDLDNFISSSTAVLALNSVVSTHTTQIAALQSDVAALQAQITGPALLPDYDPLLAYTLNQSVKQLEASGRYNLYVANNNLAAGELPGVNPDWLRIGDFYTVQESDDLLANKADLVGGVVPVEQTNPVSLIMTYIAVNLTARNAIMPQTVNMRVYVTGNNKAYVYEPGHPSADADGFVEESGGKNIYNSDGTLTEYRSVNGDSFGINWGGFDSFDIQAETFSVITVTGALYLEGGNGIVLNAPTSNVVIAGFTDVNISAGPGQQIVLEAGGDLNLTTPVNMSLEGIEIQVDASGQLTLVGNVTLIGGSTLIDFTTPLFLLQGVASASPLTEFFRADGTWAEPPGAGGVGSTLYFTALFTGDGSTTVYTISEVEPIKIIAVYVGGQRMREGVHYTKDNFAKTVTFTDPVVAGIGIEVDYFIGLSVAGGGGDTIYTADGTLTSDRTLSGASIYSLTFSSLVQFFVTTLNDVTLTGQNYVSISGLTTGVDILASPGGRINLTGAIHLQNLPATDPTAEYFRGDGTWAIPPGAGGGANIYNSDGTLTSNRTLDGGGATLFFQNINSFLLEADAISFASLAGSITIGATAGQITIFASDVVTISSGLQLDLIGSPINLAATTLLLNGAGSTSPALEFLRADMTWAMPAGGGTLPDADETVKGIVQEATQEQVDLGVGTGDTSARLFVNPEKLLKYTDIAVTARGLWDYQNVTTTPVADGKVRFNSTVIVAINSMRIAQTSSEGVDGGFLFATLLPGDIVFIQQKTDASKWARFKITALPVDNGTWWTFPIVLIDSSGALPAPNNSSLIRFTETADSNTTARLDDLDTDMDWVLVQSFKSLHKY